MNRDEALLKNYFHLMSNHPNENSSPKEIPTQEFLANEARDFLIYAAQEGTHQDVQAFYDGLDIEKILAFIEVEGKGLNRLPAVIAEVLLKDPRKEIQDALKANPAIFEHPHFFSVKEWGEMHGLNPEDVVKKGRQCVANILNRVAETGRELREEEITGIRNMAYNIPDPAVIEAILPLAEKYASISMELVRNSAITPEQINRIVNAILRGKETNKDWIDVVVELIAHQYPKLDEVMKERLANDKDIKTYMDIFQLDTKKQSDNGNGKNGNGKNGNGKKRKTTQERREERRKRRLEREAYLAELEETGGLL